MKPLNEAGLELRELARIGNRALFKRIQNNHTHKAFHHLTDPGHEDYGKRFNFFKGGRGGMRTTSIARAFVDWMADGPVRLCAARSFQNSIADSNKQAIEDQINALGIRHRFSITDKHIESDVGGVCTFRGLERNPDSFKSFESLDALWWEEANAATRATLDKVTPTLRKKGSRLIFSYNPEDRNDPIENLQKVYMNHPLGCVIRHTNYTDNPWVTQELIADALSLKASDYERYLHVFEGQYWSQSEASILGKKLRSWQFEVGSDFEGPFIGVDWGFSKDPTAVTESYIKDNKLFIRRAFNKVRLELDDTVSWLVSKVPAIEKYASYADSARPETISKVSRSIPLMRGVVKGKGSVEDGVVYLQSFDEIVVHPECSPDTLSELRSYCYKVDKNDNVTKVIVDESNHYADSLRYGHSPKIRNNTPSFGRHGIGYGRN
jgi:phage terminase large subunit